MCAPQLESIQKQTTAPVYYPNYALIRCCLFFSHKLDNNKRVTVRTDRINEQERWPEKLPRPAALPPLLISDAGKVVRLRREPDRTG